MSEEKGSGPSTKLLLSPRQFFEESVENALTKRGMKTYPAVQMYLVELLEFYLDSKNLFGDISSTEGPAKGETFAEAFLRANQAEAIARKGILKRLGDRALYLSGFFGDSLERKIVDVDYYADIGVAAYSSLADETKEDRPAQVYRIFSKRFVDFVDVLTYISQQSFIKSDESILRLYDRYLRTGSELARQRLHEMGVVTVAKEHSRRELKS